MPPAVKISLQATARLSGQRMEVQLTLERTEAPAAAGTKSYARLVAGSLHNDSLLLNQSVLLEQFPSPYTASFVVDCSKVAGSMEVVATLILDRMIGCDVTQRLAIPAGAELPWPRAGSTAAGDAEELSAMDEGTVLPSPAGHQQELEEAGMPEAGAAASRARGSISSQGAKYGARAKTKQSTLQAAYRQHLEAAPPRLGQQTGSQKAKVMSHFMAAAGMKRAAADADPDEQQQQQSFAYSPEAPSQRSTAMAAAFDSSAMRSSLDTWGNAAGSTGSRMLRSEAPLPAASAPGSMQPPAAVLRPFSKLTSSSAMKLQAAKSRSASLAPATGQPSSFKAPGFSLTGSALGTSSIFDRFKCSKVPEAPAAEAVDAAAAEEEAMLLAGLHDPPPLPGSFAAPLASSRRAAMQSRYQQLLGNAAAAGGNFADMARLSPGPQALPDGPMCVGGAGTSLQQLKARMLQPSNSQQQLNSSSRPKNPTSVSPGPHPGWDLSDEENEDPEVAGQAALLGAPGQAASLQHLRQGPAQRSAVISHPAARTQREPDHRAIDIPPAAKSFPAPAEPKAGAPFRLGHHMAPGQWQQNMGEPSQQAQQVLAEQAPPQAHGMQQDPVQQLSGPPAAQPANRPVLRKPVLRGRPKSSVAAWDDLLDDFMMPSQTAASSKPRSSSQMPVAPGQQPLQGEVDRSAEAAAAAPAVGAKRAAGMEREGGGGGDWLDALELQPLKRRAPAFQDKAPAAGAGAAGAGAPGTGAGLTAGMFNTVSAFTDASSMPAAPLSAAPGASQQSSAFASAGKWQPLSQVRAGAAGAGSSFSTLSKGGVMPRALQPAAIAFAATGNWSTPGHVASSTMAQQPDQQPEQQEQHDESVFDMLF